MWFTLLYIFSRREITMEDMVTITVQVPRNVAKLIAAEALIRDTKHDFYIDDVDDRLKELIGIWWSASKLLKINGEEW